MPGNTCLCQRTSLPRPTHTAWPSLSLHQHSIPNLHPVPTPARAVIWRKVSLGSNLSRKKVEVVPYLLVVVYPLDLVDECRMGLIQKGKVALAVWVVPVLVWMQLERQSLVRLFYLGICKIARNSCRASSRPFPLWDAKLGRCEGEAQSMRGSGEAERSATCSVERGNTAVAGGLAGNMRGTCALWIQPKNLIVIWNFPPPSCPCPTTAARPVRPSHGRKMVSQTRCQNPRMKRQQSGLLQLPKENQSIHG